MAPSKARLVYRPIPRWRTNQDEIDILFLPCGRPPTNQPTKNGSVHRVNIFCYFCGGLHLRQCQFQIMSSSATNPLVVDVCLVPGRLDDFLRLGAELDGCQKSLNDYLEHKRMLFPRWVFSVGRYLHRTGAGVLLGCIIADSVVTGWWLPIYWWLLIYLVGRLRMIELLGDIVFVEKGDCDWEHRDSEDKTVTGWDVVFWEYIQIQRSYWPLLRPYDDEKISPFILTTRNQFLHSFSW